MAKYVYTVTLTRKLLGIFPIKVEIYADSVTDPRFSDFLVFSKHIKKGNEEVCEDVAIFNKGAWSSISIEKKTCACNAFRRKKNATPASIIKSNTLAADELQHLR